MRLILPLVPMLIVIAVVAVMIARAATRRRLQVEARNRELEEDNRMWAEAEARGLTDRGPAKTLRIIGQGRSAS